MHSLGIVQWNSTRRDHRGTLEEYPGRVLSNPFRVIPLLGDSSPCQGNIFFRYTERARRRLILEADFEESRVVALMVFGLICIRIVDFNMYLY